jgi:hypothetical protein
MSVGLAPRLVKIDREYRVRAPIALIWMSVVPRRIERHTFGKREAFGGL